jgi:pimeloyl-ACP methyl ester carboxylesterase
MPAVRMVEFLDHQTHLEVLVEGDHPQVVMVPSANRDASEFELLARDLHAAGFDSASLNLRTIGGSTGPTEGLTLRDLADDVSEVIQHLVGRPAHVVGHAFGNTVARATAAYRPECVASVTLLACGGHEIATDPPRDEWLKHFHRCQRMDLPEEERIESLQIAFFAPGNDPRPWLTGWWPDRLDPASILRRTDPSEWWHGGTAPILIMQPLEDVLCPPRTGRALAAAVGGRARYVELAHCGHAILPERPAAVSEQIISFLQDQSHGRIA